ncbi:ift-20 [Pristionchus pacificus]|uniref:Ift-20 n=1 Tax=Pristionchus pacificus TaxID=54126 RepID=A0A2A6CQT6_PRIPA|nr:ift-20 [Pristionchus pacificus]|eukprot:PDM80575.1 ift-20 [Pristionchus pacificus]
MSEADAILKKAGLYMDDLHRLRLLAPDAWETTTALSEQSKEFSTTLDSFLGSSQSLIKTFEEVASLVEAERLRAMSLKSQLSAVSKGGGADAESKRGQIQVLIRQKEVELERLRTELEAAARVEAEQKEFIQRFNAA